MALKKLHKYKLDNDNSVIVYDNQSRSNYNRFVVVYNNNTKTTLWGTTMKAESNKEDYLNMGKHGLILCNKENIL